MTNQPGLLPPPSGSPASTTGPAQPSLPSLPSLAPRPTTIAAPQVTAAPPSDGPALPPAAPRADGIRDTSMIELPPILLPPTAPTGPKRKPLVRRIGKPLLIFSLLFGLGYTAWVMFGPKVEAPEPTFTQVPNGVRVRAGDVSFLLPAQPSVGPLDLSDYGQADGTEYTLQTPNGNVIVRVAYTDSSLVAGTTSEFCTAAIATIDEEATSNIALDRESMRGDMYVRQVSWNLGANGQFDVQCSAQGTRGVLIATASAVVPNPDFQLITGSLQIG